MIESLTGLIRSKRASSLVLEANGVGYGVSMPLSHLIQMGDVGSKVSLWIYTRVREDQLSLYGFVSEEDRFVFEILINCNGVGPKVALAIMSTMTSNELAHAVKEKNFEVFELVPGIGRRTAEKILVDLGAKVSKLPLSQSSSRLLPSGLSLEAETKNSFFPESFRHDLTSALSNLGFKDKDILPVLATIGKDYDGEDFSLVTKKALSLLSSQKSKKAPQLQAKTKTSFDTLF